MTLPRDEEERPLSVCNLRMAAAARAALLGKGARPIFRRTKCLRAMLHK